MGSSLIEVPEKGSSGLNSDVLSIAQMLSGFEVVDDEREEKRVEVEREDVSCTLTRLGLRMDFLVEVLLTILRGRG